MCLILVVGELIIILLQSLGVLDCSALILMLIGKAVLQYIVQYLTIINIE